ncbi:MAG: response regulator [Candidatus Taylorbacteria bacterium]|nr:response regulator [Candidatus Taylorbacteria bacterium]
MKQLSILFVDDDKFLLDMYSLKFSKNNFIVHTAQAGEEALKIIREGFEPDVLLLDIVMPGMDGVELLGVMRKENLIKNAVVIMLTNQGLPDDIARAKKLNVDGYIIKATTIPSEVMAEVLKIYNGSKK